MMKVDSYLPDRVATPDGIFVLDSAGHYIPEAERDEPLRYRGLIIIGAAFLLWIVFIIAATFIFEALAS